jgi:hypothetical protein
MIIHSDDVTVVFAEGFGNAGAEDTKTQDSDSMFLHDGGKLLFIMGLQSNADWP